MRYKIVYNSNPPSKIYEINESEEKFFNKLSIILSDSENDKVILHRFSNGSIEPYFNSFPIGKIKLQGRKHYMQIFKSEFKYEIVYGTIDDFIIRIPDIIKYLRKYCK